MSKLKFNLLFIILLTTSSFAQTWQFDQSPTRQNLARLDMLSENQGWVVSYDGLILKYNGKKWIISDSLNNIIDKKIIAKDSVLVSKKNIGDIYTIRVPNRYDAWLAVNNVSQRFYLVVHSNMKINQYHAQKFPIKVRAFDFWDSEFGIAVGEGGGYLYKNNKWIQLNLPVSVDFKNVKFIKQDVILICGEKGTLIQGDGQNWTKIETGINATLRDMDFISDVEGWIVGNGVILKYLNGEIQQEIAETTNDLWAVDMMSKDFGFAVGEKGTFLKYGKDYWDLLNLNTDVDFHDIEMINDSLGFVVGARGAILKYTNNKMINGSSHQFLFSDQVHLGSEYLMDRITDVYGVTAADFNNDNLPDMYLTCYKSLNHQLINQGDGYYQDYVIESGTGGNVETRVGKEKYEFGSLAADFDRDGDTDLLLAGKQRTTTYFLNNGRAVFKDATSLSGLPDNLEIIDGALADFNEDGYPDFVLADENNGVRIFLNQKYNHFYEQKIESLNLPLTGVRTVKVSDLNNDHHQDIFVAYTHKTPSIIYNSGNAEWRVSGENEIQGIIPKYINSISFSDFNKDGINDFYLCSEDDNDAIYIFNQNSKVFENRSTKWKIKRGGRSYTAAIADFNLDGNEDIYVSKYGPDFLFLNSGENRFIEVGQDMIYSKAGYLSGFNTGSAVSDFDNNGTPDMVVGNSDYWSSILQNLEKGQNYLKINLIGVQDTKECLGAKIWIWHTGKPRTSEYLLSFKEMNPSSGLFSQNEQIAIFGLGSLTHVDVNIRFLNGDEKSFTNVQAGTQLTVFQSAWFNRQVYATGRAILQFLHIPDMMWVILRFLVFIIVIWGSVRFIENRYNWRPAHTVLYALILIPMYLLQTVYMTNTGVFYHVLPFLMILFAMLVLVAVNEPIRKTNEIQNFRQEKMQEASVRLSTSPEEYNAFLIVRNTLNLIYPNCSVHFYTYHHSGNYFLYKGDTKSLTDIVNRKIVVDRNKIQQLKEEKSPLDYNRFAAYWKDLPEKYNDSLIFLLIRKKRILGLAVLKSDNVIDDECLTKYETLNYLFLQLAIALDNIRILKNLKEQEKISAIGTFSSGIIHNLKNPIDGLRLIVEMLRQEIGKDDSRKEYVEELYSGIKQLKQKLVSSFDFVNYDEEFNDKVSINELIKEILKEYNRSDFSPFSIELDDKEFTVNGDPEQLTFAFENVIQNAVEASDLSKPIEVNTRSANGGKMVEIKIRDHGSGIPDENLDKIFDMFYSTRGKSRGLGLTLTRNIIKNHKGYIDVDSRKNLGTNFSIFLPLT